MVNPPRSGASIPASLPSRQVAQATPDWEALGQLPDLATALERARTPPGFELAAAYFGMAKARGWDPSSKGLLLILEGVENWPPRFVDPVTGEDITPDR